MTSLQKRIVVTLSYFDIFDYPLTSLEIWKWLYASPDLSRELPPASASSLADIINELEDIKFQAVIGSKNGFYFLLGRGEIVWTRLDRYCLAKKKFKTALRVAKLLRFIAFVEMAAVCNNVGYNNGSAKSDIDFFIVVKTGRLWWTRLLITLLVTAFGLRRHGQNITDRICLSFYTTPLKLDLAEIKNQPTDPYLAYWLATLAPIYDRTGIYPQLIKTNDWLKSYLPNFYPTKLSSRRSVADKLWINSIRKLDEVVFRSFIGDWFERLAKKVQYKRIRRYAGQTAILPTTEVIISDEILKLHTTDRRQYYRQLLTQRLNQFLG